MSWDQNDTTGAPEDELKSALIVAADAEETGENEQRATPGPIPRYWRAELARWLLTLNPGRTQDEYSKAVTYFFTAPGAPQSLDDLSLDLLLAYRGSLAMRAERLHAARSPHRPGGAGGPRVGQLTGQSSASRRLAGDQGSNIPPQPPRPSALAPATVNLRLTALRQFLRFALLREPLAKLSIERIQTALRRLPIERRRPYQILGEEEWPAFLAAARAPMQRATPQLVSQAQETPSAPPDLPWGVTRAERARAREHAPNDVDAADGTGPERRTPVRAHDGRTGVRTAQRDEALVALALATGLRAIELSLLDVGDLTRERRHGQIEWWLILPDEKTKGQRGGRALPLAPEVAMLLLAYIETSGRTYASVDARTTPLFLALTTGVSRADGDIGVGASGQHALRRLRPEQIRSVINRVETQWLARQREEDASEDNAPDGRRISPHALRHSAAIALLKGDEATRRPPASVEHVRGWLGHFDIRTTQRYLDHLSSRDERRRFTITPSVQHAALSTPADETTAPSGADDTVDRQDTIE